MGVAVVASLTGDMAAQSFGYHAQNPPVIHGLCAMTKSAIHARSGSLPL